MIPEAHIHGGPRWPARLRAARRWRRETSAGKVTTWSASLGALQAVLLLSAAGGNAETLPALAGLTAVFAIAAALVVGTVWILRLAIPAAHRAMAVAVPAAFYGAAALASPHGGVLAATLLAPAIAWSTWLPSGTFAITSRAAR